MALPRDRRCGQFSQRSGWGGRIARQLQGGELVGNWEREGSATPGGSRGVDPNAWSTSREGPGMSINVQIHWPDEAWRPSASTNAHGGPLTLVPVARQLARPGFVSRPSHDSISRDRRGELRPRRATRTSCRNEIVIPETPVIPLTADSRWRGGIRRDQGTSTIALASVDASDLTATRGCSRTRDAIAGVVVGPARHGTAPGVCGHPLAAGTHH